MTNAPDTKRAAPDGAVTPTGELRPVAGFTWELFFIILAWTAAYATIPALLFRMSRGAKPSTFFWMAFWIYFGLTYLLTMWLSNKYRERQRKTLMSAHELLSHDVRPHVLYLRSFKDDETTSRLLNLSTEEQELAVVMLEIGPFIAFGEPCEEVPDPGAARIYVEDEHWRENIKKLISEARLVVARMGNTESLWWEMETASKLLPPERLLLFLPENKTEYEVFRQKAKQVFPHQLPEYEFRPPRSSLSKSHISSEGFIYFEPDWTPRLQRLKPTMLRQNYWAPGVPIFKMALRPVYQRLGVDWKHPPLQPLQIFPVIMLLLVSAFTVYVMLMQLAQLAELFRPGAAR